MNQTSIVLEYCASHGGASQRDRASAAVCGNVPSPLADELESLFVLGYLSAALVNSLATAGNSMLTVRGIAPDPQLEKLAHGTSHQRTNMLRALKPPASCPTPFRIRVPCVAQKMRSIVSFVCTQVFLVNEIVEMLYREWPSRFRDLLGGASLRDFWSQVRPDDPRLQDTTLTSRDGWMDRAIPFILHGDAAEFTMWGNSLACLNFGGLLSSGWSAFCWLLGCFPKVSRCHGAVHGRINDTWAVIYQYVVHAFNGLYMGIHPELDPFDEPWPANSRAAHLAGKQICDGKFFGTCLQFSGDREWLANEWGFNHWTCKHNCGFCPVLKGDTDFSCNASWKLRSYTALENPGKFSHPVWHMYGVSRFAWFGDWAHGVEGGVLLYLHFEALDCLRTVACHNLGALASVERLWGLLAGAYSKCGVQESRLQCLSVKMIDRPVNGHKFLKAKHAISKALVRPLLQLLQEWYDGSDVMAHMILAYEHVVAMFVIIDSNLGLFMDILDASTLLEHADGFLAHYKTMRGLRIEDGRDCFPITNKFHTLWHICFFARYQHPRSSWTYVWEDFMGVIQRIGRSCTRGTAMHKTSDKIMDNFSRVVAMRLRRGGR